MKLSVRPYELGRDYPDICEWWRGHGWAYVPAHLLPRVGLIIESDDGQKLCAGFLYTAESSWGWLEWVVTNPQGPMRYRKDAVDLLVSSLVDIARASGMERIISSLHRKSLIRIFEKHGFRKGDVGATEMVWGA